MARPGNTYGRAESLDSDFGASDGYTGAVAAGPAVYGAPSAGGADYPAADDYDNAAPADDYDGSGYGTPAGNDYDGSAGAGYGTPVGNDYDGPAGSGYGTPVGNDYDGPAGTGYGTPVGNDYGGSAGQTYGAPASDDFVPAAVYDPAGPSVAAPAPGKTYGGTYGGGTYGGGTYGSAAGSDYDDGAGVNGYGPEAEGYGTASYEAADEGYEEYGYGPVSGDYPSVQSGAVYGAGTSEPEDAEGYGLEGGYDGPVPGKVTGDPNYRARRHRPSANDTNIGTLADFAEYNGYDAGQQHDERYVNGYGPRGGRH